MTIRACDQPLSAIRFRVDDRLALEVHKIGAHYNLMMNRDRLIQKSLSKQSTDSHDLPLAFHLHVGPDSNIEGDHKANQILDPGVSNKLAIREQIVDYALSEYGHKSIHQFNALLLIAIAFLWQERPKGKSTDTK